MFYVYMYIHIYIEREGKRERERDWYIYVCVCILGNTLESKWIYMYICMSMCIYTNVS